MAKDGGMKEEKLPKTLGEAQERLYDVEEKLNLITKHRYPTVGTHYGILFHGIPKDTLIENLFKTKAVGDIDNGKWMVENLLRAEKDLKIEIKNHPILAKRYNLVLEEKICLNAKIVERM